MTEKVKLTSIAELGEFGLIDHINEKVKLQNKETIKGIGDDAAVLQFDQGAFIYCCDNRYACGGDSL
jgi:thiamine monophosphate kinase